MAIEQTTPLQQFKLSGAYIATPTPRQNMHWPKNHAKFLGLGKFGRCAVVIDAKQIRGRAIHNISYECARAAGMSYAELTGFISGSYWPSERQLLLPARFLKMKEVA